MTECPFCKEVAVSLVSTGEVAFYGDEPPGVKWEQVWPIEAVTLEAHVCNSCYHLVDVRITSPETTPAEPCDLCNIQRVIKAVIRY